MRKKWLLSVAILFCLTFIGCGKTTIEGEWVLTKKICWDGTVLDKSDIEEYGWSETYNISGETVQYTCITPEMGTRNYDMKMVSTGENEYTFYIADKLVFAVATLDGKELRYDIGTEDDMSTFIFKKK